MNIKSEKGGNDMNNRRLDRNDLIKKFDTLGLIKYLNDIVDSEIEKADKMAITLGFCRIQGLL